MGNIFVWHILIFTIVLQNSECNPQVLIYIILPKFHSHTDSIKMLLNKIDIMNNSVFTISLNLTVTDLAEMQMSNLIIVYKILSFDYSYHYF